MRYSLVIYLNNECFEIKNYSKIPGFEHINETKLKSIVEFTNNFSHEQELICYLIEEELIPQKYFKGTLEINYYKGKNSNPKTLQYGISFKEDKKFFDTIFLKHYYSNKITNLTFMKAFIKKYYTYLKDIKIFSESIGYINFCYEQYKDYDRIPEYAHEYMTKFIDIYCTKKGKDGFYKADFTRIRDLAMFAINYERDHERIPIERPENTVEEIQIMIDHYKDFFRHGDLTEEELDTYTNAMDKLEKELEYTKTVTRTRRKNNETTTN